MVSYTMDLMLFKNKIKKYDNAIVSNAEFTTSLDLIPSKKIKCITKTLKQHVQVIFQQPTAGIK